MIVTLDYATDHGITAGEIEAVAEWHMNHAEWDWGNRHDQIAYRLFALARILRTFAA